MVSRPAVRDEQGGSGEDAGSRERAIRYSRERERLWLLSTGADLALGVLALASGAPAALSRAIEDRLPRPLRPPVFVLAWSTQGWIARLPLAWYAGHAVERKYGLSNQSGAAWLRDHVKGFAIGAAINTPLLSGFSSIARRYPHRWWLVVSGLAVPITTLLAGLYPVLIAPRFNSYAPVEDAALAARVRGMAEREGVRVSQVLAMDMSRQTAKANAFFEGVGGTKRIVLADTLLGRFSPEEVEIVVAHELAHQVHRDTWKLIALSGLATVGGTYALHRVFPSLLRRTRRWTGASSLGDPAALPAIELVAGILALAGMPVANALVRRLERDADAYAVRLTGNPHAFVGAMRQLQSANLTDPDPPAWVRLLLSSHPSIGERIRWAEALPRQGARAS